MRRIPLACIILFISMASTTLGSGQASDSIILRADWKEFKTQQYVIHYPYSWQLSPDNSTGGFTLYVPGPKSFGAFEKSLNLSIQDLSGRDLDLDKYTILSARQIHTLVDNSELLESERTDTLGVSYHDIIYTGDYDEQQLKWKMRFWVVGGKAYILTYTSSKDTFSLNSKLAEEIMDTFRPNHTKTSGKKPKHRKRSQLNK